MIVPLVTKGSDGTITVVWPDPKPRTVEIAAELLEQMIEQHNRSIRALDGNDALRAELRVLRAWQAHVEARDVTQGPRR